MADLEKLEGNIHRDRNSLALRLKDLEKYIKEYAEAEEKYRVALANKLVEFEVSGMPATTASDKARGDKNVAKLKLDRDIANGMKKRSELAVRSAQGVLSVWQGLLAIERAKIDKGLYGEGD
jgi:hypothetical protein